MLTDLSNIEIINPQYQSCFYSALLVKDYFQKEFLRDFYNQSTRSIILRLRRVKRNVFIQIVLKLTGIYIEFIWT